MVVKEIVVASNNINKLNEIKQIMGDEIKFFSLSSIGFDEDIEENGSTFYENALIKAKAVSKFINKPVLADDSGLVVASLDGAPGIHSARFARLNATDEENNEKLLALLKNHEDRKAKFVCELVLLFPNNKVIHSVGEVEGSILKSPKGNFGFGYDPIFYSSELQKAFGEASSEEKNSVSHRARALRSLFLKIKNPNNL